MSGGHTGRPSLTAACQPLTLMAIPGSPAAPDDSAVVIRWLKDSMSIDASNKILFTVDEVCAATGIRRSLLYELVRRGEIPTRKLGRRRLFPVQALQRWAAASEPNDWVESGPPPRRIA